MKSIEHIGIAVNNLDHSKELFTTIFGEESCKTEIVEKEGVVTCFFQIGDSKIELLSAINTESPIAKFLEKNKEGVHHIAFIVDNIKEHILRLKSKGIRVLNEEPKMGANNKLITFLHPKDTNGVLIELCQKTE
tara:strand:+ start:334 stop:735 length:402 start_codon:yes stop_codon:yes gene_type:complete